MAGCEYEDIIEKLGSFGPFQIRVFILVSMFETPAAWYMLLPVFTGAVPAWTCPSTPSLNNNTESNNTDMDMACMPDNSVCSGISYTDEFTSIVSEWDLICENKGVSDLITTIQMVGVFIGAFVIGQLADVFGRRKVLYLVYLLLMTASFASSFTNSWQAYAAFRFFIGGFFGGTMVVNFVLPLEFVGPRWRTFCGCIGFWACGVMSLALIAFYIRDWRYLSIATSVGGIFLLFTYCFVPESPRWLLQHGRIEEAKEILTKMAEFNKKPIPDYSHLETYVQRVKVKISENRKYSYWDLCRNFQMSKNTLIILYAWFVSSSVYYGTALNIKNLSGNRYLNFFLSGLVEIPAVFFVVAINNIVGRRRTVTFLMCVAGVAMFAVLFVDLAGKLDDWWILTTSLAMIGRAGIAGGWAAAQVFAAELFPTVVRNIGIGASSMASRVGGVIAPQLVFLNTIAKPLPFIVFGSLAMLCAVLSMFLPETLGKPLPDTLPPRSCGRSSCCRRQRHDSQGAGDTNNACNNALLEKENVTLDMEKGRKDTPNGHIDHEDGKDSSAALVSEL